MGNCCGISSDVLRQHEHGPGPGPIPENTYSPLIESSFNIINLKSETRTNTPFIETPDPMGLGVGSSSPSNDIPTSTTGEIVEDQRLLSLLEFFRQLHFRRQNIFNQIISVHQKAFEDIFDKMTNKQLEKKESMKLVGVVMQRSRSSDELKKERFKVKPIDSPNDKIKGGGSKPPVKSK